MSTITVKELMEQLKLHNPNDLICFGPDKHFEFYRIKDRSGVVQIEFNEVPGSDYELLPDHPINK